MPKLKSGPGRIQMCTVKGRLLLANGEPLHGTITIVPERMGIWSGQIFLNAPINITPNSDGEVEVALPPSFVDGKPVMGVYRVRTRPERYNYWLIVPDNRSEITLAELLQIGALASERESLNPNLIYKGGRNG